MDSPASCPPIRMSCLTSASNFCSSLKCRSHLVGVWFQAARRVWSEWKKGRIV